MLRHSQGGWMPGLGLSICSSYLANSCCFLCSLFKGNPCPLVQPPINGKIEPSQAKYTFKDQVVISCNTGYKVLKVWGGGVELGGKGAWPPLAIFS